MTSLISHTLQLIGFGQTMPKIVIIISLFANALLKASKTTTVMKSVIILFDIVRSQKFYSFLKNN